MELAELIAALSDPRAYPEPAETVSVHQTHISVVFVVGRWVYKIRKPVRLAFLDYGTLERRRGFCAEEVRINARLAPWVYRGVVAVARQDGMIRVEGPGEVVEWAVKMVRLPEEATLRACLERGSVGVEGLADLARRLVAFHARAERSEQIAHSGRFDVVAQSVRANFQEAEEQSQVGTMVSQAVFERLRRLSESALERHRGTIEARAARGVPCDTHGDLRLDHVYFLNEGAGGGGAAGAGAGASGVEPEVVIIDGIEFNAQLRHADPVADMAFLVMDLEALGRHALASAFAEAYFAASGDAEGRELLPFYVAYRAVVRGKVEGLMAVEPEVGMAERAEARTRARARWLLGLGALAGPGERPCLVLIGGLPGTGKSTLGRALAESAGFTVIRSDSVRKELTGGGGADPAGAASALASEPGEFETGIYTPEWTERTYAECLRRVADELWEGRRVAVDASFGAEVRRRLFLDAGARLGVPVVLLLCEADPAVVAERLRGRTNDISDANWLIYRRAADAWEPLGPDTEASASRVDTVGTPDEVRERALAALRGWGPALVAGIRAG